MQRWNFDRELRGAGGQWEILGTQHPRSWLTREERRPTVVTLAGVMSCLIMAKAEVKGQTEKEKALGGGVRV